jgi:hypothetical protein
MIKKQLLLILFLFAAFTANAELAAPNPAPADAIMMPVPEESSQAEPSAAIHEELRGLLQGIEAAINTEKYADLKPYFSQQMRVTTINQQVLSSPNEIDGYFKSWFGKGGYLIKMDMKLNPDALTQLYGEPANPNWGLVRGAGTENYQLADGRFLPMKTRWTATVVKEADDKWRILALHIGANFFDNPIFDEVYAKIKWYAAGGLALGLLLGALGMGFLRRKKH